MERRPFPQNLRYLREAAGYTQEQMGRMLHITRQSYCHYENVLREPNLDTLIRLADIFQVSLDTLLLDETLPYRQESLWKLNENT